MRLDNLRESKNVERRRGGGKKKVLGGGLGAIVMAVVAIFVFNQDPSKVIGQLSQGQGQSGNAKPATPEQEKIDQFVRKIKGSTENVWTRLLRENQGRNRFPRTYRVPKLINYDGSTPMKSGGLADSRMGPFYVPSEEQIYIDTAFFRTMDRELGGGGDFAYAYVIAHEVGHHVQKLTGRTDYVHQQRSRLPEAQYNQLSVRLELQADFYAGVWAHHANKAHRSEFGTDLLDKDDVPEAMRSAKAIGDDTLQRKAGQRIQEEKFNHGTSEQRMRWFLKGIETGDLKQGDTFSPPYHRL